jgi:hypothetical protein
MGRADLCCLCGREGRGNSDPMMPLESLISTPHSDSRFCVRWWVRPDQPMAGGEMLDANSEFEGGR